MTLTLTLSSILLVSCRHYDSDTNLFLCLVCSTQRWQRRVFVLYDGGDLTYSVDENVRSEMFCSFFSSFLLYQL